MENGNQFPGRGVLGKTSLLWIHSILGSTLTVLIISYMPLGKLLSLSLSFLISNMKIIIISRSKWVVARIK